MEDNLEKSIMGKIKTGQVKIRSKYVFIAEKLGLGTAFALSVLLSILLFNLILFYLKETDNLKYLSFGKFGVFAFLESFPYLLVIAFVVLIVLSGYLITKSDVSYKKPFGYLAVGLAAFIMIFGGILTYTNLGKNFEKQARKGNGSIGMFFNPLTEVRNNGVAGIVYEVGEDSLVLQTPHGLRNVEIGGIDDLPEITKGQFIIAVGKSDGFDFKAEKIKIADKEDMPAVERGIDFKFNQGEVDPKDFSPSMFYFNEEEKKCVQNCLDLENGKDCFRECRE